jgi:hypothetical protein
MTWGWNSGLALPENQWVLASLVVEPSQATIYLRDGNQLFSATNLVPNSIEEFDGALSFGRDTYDSTRYFVGSMDEVRIYNRALPATEIAQLYAEAFTPPNIRTIIARQGNDLVLSWLGGTAPYQVQIATNLASLNWQNLGPSINSNHIVITPSNPAAFYRILRQ